MAPFTNKRAVLTTTTKFLLAVLVIGSLTTWDLWSHRAASALHAALGHKVESANLLFHAWITPPHTTKHAHPIILATPADLRHTTETLEVPEGSTLAAHLMAHDATEAVPSVSLNGATVAFATSDEGGFSAQVPVTHDDTLIIRRGATLGVDYALTVSCYQAQLDGAACGRCDSCRIRKAGFAAAGVADPTRYV